MAIPSLLGERLLLARHRAGLTQQALATQMGVNAHTIGLLERGGFRDVKSHHVRAAAKILGVSTDYLLGMDLEEGTTP